jgi:bifunctional UDP-N-acetylglucosamine pyrophosphorylase / glucosamine-1-phosphate N-acetyltransferase
MSTKTAAEIVAEDARARLAATERLIAAGVILYRPETAVIDPEVEVAPGTILEPFVQLLGKTRVGSGCRIRSFSVLEDCTLADGVLIRQSCVLEECSIGSGAKIGPFAHLRPGSEIGEEVHIGNFVETKKAKLHKGVKAGHLTYLGDAEVGANTNIGAGVITCNYDGVHKHRTEIGANSFIGSDSTLVAPVALGEGTFVAAGSCITRNVPAGALAVARNHQIVKEGWAHTRHDVQKK